MIFAGFYSKFPSYLPVNINVFIDIKGAHITAFDLLATRAAPEHCPHCHHVKYFKP